MSNEIIDLDLSKKTDYKKFKKWYKKSSTKEVCDSIRDMAEKGENYSLNLAYISNYVDKHTRMFPKIRNVIIELFGMTVILNYILSLSTWLFLKVRNVWRIFFTFYSTDRKTDNFTLGMPRYPQDINIQGHISNSTFFTAVLVSILSMILISQVVKYSKKNNI